jgi:rubrerythrin
MAETYTRVQNVIENSRTVHHQLRQYYKMLEDKSHEERIRMLLEYLSRHERHLEDVLDRFGQQITRHILDMRVQYVPEPADTEISQQALTVTPEMSLENVFKTALQMEDYLIQTYASIAGQTAYPEVRETFEDLIRMETNEKKGLSNALEELMEL